MKNVLKIFVLFFCMIAVFSCGKEATGDREVLYSIAHSSGISIYGYTCDAQEVQAKINQVNNYLHSFNRDFSVIGFGDYGCNNKAKEYFKQAMRSFTQEKLQTMLNDVFGDNVKGRITIQYYVYVSDREYFGEYIDVTHTQKKKTHAAALEQGCSRQANAIRM